MDNLSLLCQVDSLLDGYPRGVRTNCEGKLRDLIVIRKAGRVFVYINSCPHQGTPLNWTDGQFLDKEEKHLICATHGALFRIEDGFCLGGPCAGKSLRAVSIRVRNGAVYSSY